MVSSGAHLPGLFCPDWSPVWLIPVRVTPSAAFFFSLRLRVRFRSADHSWAIGHKKEIKGSFLGNYSGPKYLFSQQLPTPCNSWPWFSPVSQQPSSCLLGLKDMKVGIHTATGPWHKTADFIGHDGDSRTRFEGWGCRSVEECLPSIHKVMGSIPSNTHSTHPSPIPIYPRNTEPQLMMFSVFY